MLVLSSALIHPVRDLTLKGVKNAFSGYFGVIVTWIVLAAIQITLSDGQLTLPPEALTAVFVSAIGNSAYYMGTLLALQRGDLSVNYPITRSSPVAIVVISWLFLDKSYAPAAIVAILLIIGGALMLQRSPGRVFSDARATVIATIAMLGSALYSMADAHAMLYAPPDIFLFWVDTLIALQLAFATVLVERGNRSIWRSLVSGWIESPFRGRGALAAVASYASYQLILIAFQMRADAAEVSAVRQASIPISIVLAAVLLREPSVLQRAGWGLLIACGIAILATI